MTNTPQKNEYLRNYRKTYIDNTHKERQKRYYQKHKAEKNEAKRLWRLANPEKNRLYHSRAGKNYYHKRVEYVNRIKAQPCADCGIQYHPMAMDFDHVPERGKKEFCISIKKINVTLEKLDAEIAKCDVVCATCHRLRHAKRLGLL